MKNRRRLIVNADDFGIAESTNQGIIEAHRRGIVTSTTIMVNGSAFEHAVSCLRRCPRLGVGVHFCLVAEKPVSKPDQIRTLLTDQGMFFDNHQQFLKRLMMGYIRLEEVAFELRNQLHRAIEAGVMLSHVDSHQHLHIAPGIFDIVLQLCKEYNITKVRIPSEGILVGRCGELFSMRARMRDGLSILAKVAARKAASRNFKYPEHFWGMLYGGKLTVERVLSLLKKMPHGTTEVMCHPAVDNTKMSEMYPWQYQWEQELATLMDARIADAISAHQIELISYREL